MKLVVAEQGIEVAAGVQTLAHPFPRPELPLLIEVLGEKVAAPKHRVPVVEPGSIEPAVDDRPAVHPVVPNAPAHQRHGIAGQTVELASLLQTDTGDETLGRQGVATADESAVATRRPPTHLPGFQHHDAGAALAQPERRRQPRESAADHTDLGVDVAHQGRPRRTRRHAAAVVAVDVVHCDDPLPPLFAVRPSA
jgi:hypothetical protein